MFGYPLPPFILLPGKGREGERKEERPSKRQDGRDTYLVGRKTEGEK